MSIGASATLVYGVDLGQVEEEEVAVPWEHGEDVDDGFDDWLAEIAGASTKEIWATYEPWLAQHPEHSRDSHSDKMAAWERAYPGSNAALDAAYARQRVYAEACPIEVVYHCSYAYSMTIVAVRGTSTSASGGEATKVAGLPPVDDSAARAFCEEHGVPFDGPSWLLCSMYG